MNADLICVHSRKMCGYLFLIADSLKACAHARGWQGDAERGAVAWSAFDADASGVFLNDSIRDSQTEAGSLANALGGVERIVNLGYILGRDTDSGVGDLGHDRAIIADTGCDRDSPAVGNRITRVENEIREDLLQLARVSVSFRRVFSIATNDLDLAATQLRFEQLQSVVEHARYISFRELSRAAGA